MSQQTLTVDQLAKVLLIDARRIQQLSQQGWIPKAERGQYELIPSIHGYIRFLQDSVQRRGPQEIQRLTDEQKLRKEQLICEHKALNLAERKGELLDRMAVEATWLKILAIVKNQLLNIPARVADKLANLKTAPEIEAELRTRIHDILQELADAECTGIPDCQSETSSAKSVTAAESDGESVG